MASAAPPTGVGLSYLARVAEQAELPHAPFDNEEAQPLWGALAEFKDKNCDDTALLSQLNNKVKVCAKCGKGCGYTLANCNSCNASLADVQVSFTDNVFMGFVYGIGKGKFPYKISVRKQTADFLCFDDPLTLSPAHLNIIPTSVYCPDLRFLFLDPVKGLKLLIDLLDFGTQAVVKHFWSNDAFRRKYFNDAPVPTKEEMLDFVSAGMNFPPSMNQLHMQFISPPLLPHHFAMLLDENHFTHKRFFPLRYLISALSLGKKAKLRVTDDTSIDEIIEHFDRLGVNYDSHHTAFLRNARVNQQKCAGWSVSDFELLVINGQAHSSASKAPTDVDPKAIMKEDEKKIGNYGWPHVDGRPAGTYYKFQKKPGEVPFFPAHKGGLLKMLAICCG